MQCATPHDLVTESRYQRPRKNGDARTTALRFSDTQLPALEVEVLHTYLQSLGQSEARPVQHTRHKLLGAPHLPEHSPRLPSRQHSRECLRLLAAKNRVAVPDSAQRSAKDRLVNGPKAYGSTACPQHILCIRARDPGSAKIRKKRPSGQQQTLSRRVRTQIPNATAALSERGKR
jgi:hypothetical protein